MNIDWSYVERRPKSEIAMATAALASAMMNRVCKLLSSAELALVASGGAPIDEFLNAEDTMVDALEEVTTYPKSGELLDDPLRAKLARKAWRLTNTTLAGCANVDEARG